MMSHWQNNRALTKRYTKQTVRRYGRRRLDEVYQTTERSDNAGSSGRKRMQKSEVIQYHIQDNNLASNIAAGSALNRVGIWRPLSLRGTIRYPGKAKSVLDAREHSKENEIDNENQHISTPVSTGSIEQQHHYAVKKEPPPQQRIPPSLSEQHDFMRMIIAAQTLPGGVGHRTMLENVRHGTYGVAARQDTEPAATSLGHADVGATTSLFKTAYSHDTAPSWNSSADTLNMTITGVQWLQLSTHSRYVAGRKAVEHPMTSDSSAVYTHRVGAAEPTTHVNSVDWRISPTTSNREETITGEFTNYTSTTANEVTSFTSATTDEGTHSNFKSTGKANRPAFSKTGEELPSTSTKIGSVTKSSSTTTGEVTHFTYKSTDTENRPAFTTTGEELPSTSTKIGSVTNSTSTTTGEVAKSTSPKSNEVNRSSTATSQEVTHSNFTTIDEEKHTDISPAGDESHTVRPVTLSSQLPNTVTVLNATGGLDTTTPAFSHHNVSTSEQNEKRVAVTKMTPHINDSHNALQTSSTEGEVTTMPNNTSAIVMTTARRDGIKDNLWRLAGEDILTQRTVDNVTGKILDGIEEMPQLEVTDISSGVFTPTMQQNDTDSDVSLAYAHDFSQGTTVSPVQIMTPGSRYAILTRNPNKKRTTIENNNQSSLTPLPHPRKFIRISVIENTTKSLDQVRERGTQTERSRYYTTSPDDFMNGMVNGNAPNLQDQDDTVRPAVGEEHAGCMDRLGNGRLHETSVAVQAARPPKREEGRKRERECGGREGEGDGGRESVCV